MSILLLTVTLREGYLINIAYCLFFIIFYLSRNQNRQLENGNHVELTRSIFKVMYLALKCKTVKLKCENSSITCFDSGDL